MAPFWFGNLFWSHKRSPPIWSYDEVVAHNSMKLVATAVGAFVAYTLIQQDRSLYLVSNDIGLWYKMVSIHAKLTCICGMQKYQNMATNRPSIERILTSLASLGSWCSQLRTTPKSSSTEQYWCISWACFDFWSFSTRKFTKMHQQLDPKRHQKAIDVCIDV